MSFKAMSSNVLRGNLRATLSPQIPKVSLNTEYQLHKSDLKSTLMSFQ